jgi:hypothetical protein
MSRVPLAVPLPWTNAGAFLLQARRLRFGIGSDYQRFRRGIG